MGSIDRSQYRIIDSDPFEGHYLTIDPSNLTDSTIVLLLRYSKTYGNNFNYDDEARTKTIQMRTRYDVIGCRHLSPSLSHSEQAAQIQNWLADLDKQIYTTLNIADIGEPAARAFRALRPDHFQLNERCKSEHLRSLILA